MKKHLKFCSILTIIILLTLFEGVILPGENLHSVWAVKDCQVVTRPGAVIQKANVIIRDGLIEAVGTDVMIPKDAEIIDGTQMTMYPGFADGLGQSLLKFPDEKFDPTKMYTGQYNDKDKGIVPDLKALDYFQISKSTLEKYHKHGFTTVQVMPENGIFTGQAAVFSLSGQDKYANLILRDTCLGIGFSYPSIMVYPSSLMGVVAFLRQEISDALYYKKHSSRWAKEKKGIPRPRWSEKQEAISGFVSGEKPIIFLCRNQHDIRRAINLSLEFKLDYFICDIGNEAFKVIPELKKAKARVLCPVNFKVPATSIHSQRGREEREKAEKEIYVKNPAKLAEAGIPFVFSSLGTDDPASFIEGIQKAVQNGLPRDKAMEALTTRAANFFGLDKALGTIEPGKIANLVLMEGEFLNEGSKVKYVFADGNKFELKEAKVKEGEAPTVNISGKWELNIEGQGIKLTVDFVQEESALSGKMTTPFGIFDFSGGAVIGNEFYFDMTLSVGGQELELYFSATVEGEKMTGSVVQGTEGSAEFTGKRIPG